MASLVLVGRWLACLALGVIGACRGDSGRAPTQSAEAAHQRRDVDVATLAARATLRRNCPCVTGLPLEAASLLRYGPVLGAVTDRSIKVWARGDLRGNFLVRMWPSDRPQEPRCSAPITVDAASDFTGVARLAGLEPSTAYSYRLEVASAASACATVASAESSFRTLPTEGEPLRIRFAVGADVHGEDVPGFADVAAVDPDFVLMIGDNVYADEEGYYPNDYDATFELQQSLYHAVWGGSQFHALFSSVPVNMIWDDHEIMENYWASKNDLRYAVSRTLYDLYQGSHNPPPLVPGELYYTFRAGDIGFFVLDTRSHRDDNTDPDGAGKSMLGARQRQAFEQWLADDDSAVHVIVSSVLVSSFSTTGADPWKSFAVERDAWLDVIADNGTKNTFIISGDQHWSAVVRIEHGELTPYTLYEFQSTPLAAGERVAPRRPDGTVVALDNTHQVFGVFDVDTRVDPAQLDFTLCAVGEPCRPHQEPPPTRPNTIVPHSTFFQATARGFAILPPQ